MARTFIVRTFAWISISLCVKPRSAVLPEIHKTKIQLTTRSEQLKSGQLFYHLDSLATITTHSSLLLKIINMRALALILSDKSVQADDESTTYAFSPTTDVALSHYDESSEADDKSPAYRVSKTQAESDDERVTYASHETSGEQLLKDQSGATKCDPVGGAANSGLEADMVAVDTDRKSLTEKRSGEPLEKTPSHHVDVEKDPEMEKQESATTTVNKKLMKNILSAQTEETGENLAHIAQDTAMDQSSRNFAGVLAEIVCLWQRFAQGEDPTCYQIDFGVGQPLTLLMVLALLPEQYQSFICIEDAHRSPFEDGANLSWLHEQTMDVLAGLSADPVPASRHFGPGLASMIRDDLDESWKKFTGRSWLEDQIHLLSNDELELHFYRFPPESKNIVFFFNPTEAHWTVVEVKLDVEVWTYTLYNSLCQGKKGPAWKACQEQLPLLEQLICRASGFPEPKTREIVVGASAQQDNPYDCGPIAIYNVQELLEGNTPSTDVDTEDLRRRDLYLIYDALRLLEEGLEIPEFRARMRKMYMEEYLSDD